MLEKPGSEEPGFFYFEPGICSLYLLKKVSGLTCLTKLT